MKIDINLHKHFSFDLWLTLIKSNPNFKNRRDVLFKDYFEINDSQLNVSNTIRKYDMLCNNISEKTGRHIYYHNIYYLILAELNKNIDEISIKKIDEFYILKEKLFFEYVPILIYPEISNILQQIKIKEKTASISSNTAFIQGATLRNIISYYSLSEYFSFQIYSDEIGVSKPNPLFFEEVYRNVKLRQIVSKKDIVHIGDNKFADYYGAISYGFNGIIS